MQHVSELYAKHTRNGRHLKNPEIRDKCVVVSLPMPDCQFASYFQVFQMSTISRVFGQYLWNLAAS